MDYYWQILLHILLQILQQILSEICQSIKKSAIIWCLADSGPLLTNWWRLPSSSGSGAPCFQTYPNGEHQLVCFTHLPGCHTFKHDLLTYHSQRQGWVKTSCNACVFVAFLCCKYIKDKYDWQGERGLCPNQLNQFGNGNLGKIKEEMEQIMQRKPWKH